MVLISSKKYACETCIKGHRSSSCKHTDRPLYEIKKKGRPVTQCEHCRELRKTKQVHVKCICQKVEPASGGEQASSSSKKGLNKMLESAAFPNGLPEALEASVALQLLSEGASSDSDVGCSCLTGGDCHCCFPKETPKARRKGKSTSESPISNDTNAPTSSSSGISAPIPKRISSHVLNRIAEFRPVLPKPPHMADVGPSHDPNTAGPGAARHHLHESTLYSPYGRAYDYTHPHHPNIPHANTTSNSPNPNYPYNTQGAASVQAPEYVPAVNSNYPHYNSTPTIPSTSASSPSPVDERVSLDESHPAFDAADIEAWRTFQSSSATDVISSLCGCGDGCACPNCAVHKTNTDNNGSNASSSCVNTTTCRSCIDCSAFSSFPSALEMAANSASPTYENGSDTERDGSTSAIDDWIRQVASLPSFENMQLNVPSFELPPASEIDVCNTCQHGSGECRCPSGLCHCGSGDGPSSGLSYAVSGERASCSESDSNSGGGHAKMDSLPAVFDETGFGSYDMSLEQTPMNQDRGLPPFSTAFGSGPGYFAQVTLDSMSDMASLSFDLGMGMLRSRSSSSTSETSSATSLRGSDTSSFGDLGEMSMFFRAGTGAGGGRGLGVPAGRLSATSLPDTFGFF